VNEAELRPSDSSRFIKTPIIPKLKLTENMLNNDGIETNFNE